MKLLIYAILAAVALYFFGAIIGIVLLVGLIDIIFNSLIDIDEKK